MFALSLSKMTCSYVVPCERATVCVNAVRYTGAEQQIQVAELCTVTSESSQMLPAVGQGLHLYDPSSNVNSITVSWSLV